MAEKDSSKPNVISTQASRLLNLKLRYQAKCASQNHSDDPTIWRRNRKFECDICGIKYCTRRELQNHKLLHDNEKRKPFNCHLCSFSTSTRFVLDNHVKKHDVVRVYECDMCEYTCTNFSALEDHCGIHGGMKAFKCTFCTYATNNSGHLNEHMRKHTHERPYKCDVCGKTYSFEKRYLYHKSTHCSDFQPDQVLTSKQHRCGLCSKLFYSSVHLLNHISTHTREKPYTCKYCEFTTAYPRSIKNHLESKHKDCHDTEPALYELGPTSCDTFKTQSPEENHGSCEQSNVSTDECTTTATEEAPVWKSRERRPKSRVSLKRKAGLARMKASEKQSFVCEFCRDESETAMELIEHLRHHTGQKLYKCKAAGCNFRSGDLQYFRKHEKSHLWKRKECEKTMDESEGIEYSTCA